MIEIMVYLAILFLALAIFGGVFVTKFLWFCLLVALILVIAGYFANRSI